MKSIVETDLLDQAIVCSNSSILETQITIIQPKICKMYREYVFSIIYKRKERKKEEICISYSDVSLNHQFSEPQLFVLKMKSKGFSLTEAVPTSLHN